MKAALTQSAVSYLFPRLHHLFSRGHDFDQIHCAVHPKLAYLTLELTPCLDGDEDADPDPVSCSHVAHNMASSLRLVSALAPKLVSLKVIGPIDGYSKSDGTTGDFPRPLIVQSTPALLHIISSFSHLRVLDIAEALLLSDFSHFFAIEGNHPQGESNNFEGETIPASSLTRENYIVSIPKFWLTLKSVRISADVELLSYLADEGGLASVNSLDIQLLPTSLSPFDVGLVQQLCEGLGDTCKQLRQFSLCRRGAPHQPPEALVTAEASLPFGVIKPFLGFGALQKFVLQHPLALHLEPEEIDIIARSWPLIEELDLNSAPCTILTTHAVSIFALQSFAKLCHKLTSLSVFISCRKPLIPQGGTIHRSTVPFTRLKTLFFGTSVCDPDDKTWAFLIRALPPLCEIDASSRAYPFVGQHALPSIWWSSAIAYIANTYEQFLAWQAVNQQLHSREGILGAVRSVAEMLQEENRSLRCRIHDLEDRLGVEQ